MTASVEEYTVPVPAGMEVTFEKSADVVELYPGLDSNGEALVKIHGAENGSGELSYQVVDLNGDEISGASCDFDDPIDGCANFTDPTLEIDTIPCETEMTVTCNTVGYLITTFDSSASITVEVLPLTDPSGEASVLVEATAEGNATVSALVECLDPISGPGEAIVNIGECDDDDDCNFLDDSCNEGICVGNLCMIDPSYPKDGYSCDDELYCTVGDQCTNGECVATARNCDDGLFCTGVEYCDEDINQCVKPGSPCSWLCDEVEDICLIPNPPPPPPPPDCETDEDCNDDNPCTDDICDSGSCNNTQVDDGTECDDGLYCTVDDSCSDGECEGTARDCDDELFCTGIESCNEGTNQCESSGDPCPDQECNEDDDECIPVGPPCDISLDPETAEVLSGQSQSFTVITTGDCSDPDYKWSVEGTTIDIGSSIDEDTGLYTAGINNDFFNQATDVVKVVDQANGDISAEATVKVSWQCFLLMIYGEGSEEADLMRNFRDTMLSKTPEGQEIIRLYYEWSPNVVKIMQYDEEFKEEVKAAIDEILPLLGEKLK